MRLFGKIGGTVNEARASYGFLLPFDLALSVSVVSQDVVDHGGLILDQQSIFTDQYLIGFPDWVIPVPRRQFNPVISHPQLTGSIGGVTIYAAPGRSKGGFSQEQQVGDLLVRIDYPDPVGQGPVIASIQAQGSSDSTTDIWGTTGPS